MCVVRLGLCVFGVSAWHFSQTGNLCAAKFAAAQLCQGAGSGNGNAFPKTGNVLAIRIANGTELSASAKN